MSGIAKRLPGIVTEEEHPGRSFVTTVSPTKWAGLFLVSYDDGRQRLRQNWRRLRTRRAWRCVVCWEVIDRGEWAYAPAWAPKPRGVRAHRDCIERWEEDEQTKKTTTEEEAERIRPL